MMNSEETPHFFKIILEDTTQFNKLRIPRKFARKYGSELSGTVQLTVPDGDVTLPVEVAKSENGEVWLEKGWQQFSEHYSFKLGYFLVFVYEGNGRFQVLPFDLSCAAETEYPYISDSDEGSDKECLQPNKEEEEAKVAKPKEIVSAELLNRTPQCLEEAKDDSFNGILNQSPPDGKTSKKSRPCKRQRKTTSDKRLGLECPKTFQRLTAKEKAKTLEIANSFNSKNPFFLAVIRPSYIAKRMIIPDNFYKKFFTKTQGGKATLCLSNGKSWSVNYYATTPYNDEHPTARFVSGWRKFVRDNRLVVGDICVFELLEAAEMTFEVVIHRVEDVANCGTSQAPEAKDNSFDGISNQSPPNGKTRKKSRPCKRQRKTTSDKRLEPCTRKGRGMGDGLECPKTLQKLTAKEKAKTQEIANSFNSKNPFFLAVIKPSYASTYMSIPDNFARKFFTKTHGGNATLCLPNGKSWSVNYRRTDPYNDRNPNFRFFSGWKKFAVDNCLVAGDICVFELLEANEMTLKVVIHQVDQEDVANCGTSQVPESAAGRSFASDIPSFVKTITPSSLDHPARMWIPIQFIEEHFKPDAENVFLQVADKSWFVKLVVYKDQRMARLASGWMTFARENSLKVGDVCVFKLITSSNDAMPMLNVFISRCDG